MRQNDQGFVRAVVRRIIFAGLVIFGAWLLLFALRGAIPDSLITQMNEIRDRQPGNTPLSGIPPFSYNSFAWDWTRSIWTNEPISTLIGHRLTLTLQFVAMSGLFSLVIASILLVLGSLVGRATQRPRWLAKLRSVLRLVIVSRGASVPFFAITTLMLVFGFRLFAEPSTPNITLATFVLAVLSSVLPIWLLVQAGHGELAQRQAMPRAAQVGHMGVYLIVRTMNLIGVFVVLNIAAGEGLGRILQDTANQRDFPTLFYIAWALAVIVTLAKLAADLVQMTYERSSRLPEAEKGPSPLQSAVPKGWLIVCFALVGLSILVAVFGPMLAPHGWNEIMLQNRLAPPGPGLPLGADNVGRDILSRVLSSIRLDLFIGMAIAGIVIIVAGGWALLAERLNKAGKKNLEELVMLPLEILRAFPWLALLLLLLNMGWWGQGMEGRVEPAARISSVVLIAGAVLLPRIVVLLREAVSSRENGWLGSLRLAAPVAFIFTVAAGILYIVTVSYEGMGVPPPYPDFGNMLSGAGRQFMMEAPWMVLWPTAILAFLLMIWVMAGEALLERLGFRSKELWSKTVE